jgi:hypothetical protein
MNKKDADTEKSVSVFYCEYNKVYTSVNFDCCSY